MNWAKREISLPRYLLLLMGSLFLFQAPVWGQLEPCGFFEYDGAPGYGIIDLYRTVSYWPDAGSLPHIPDFDDDGYVTISDLVREFNCIQVGHGLLGKFYGLEDGTPDQSISFPDFDNLPGNPDPVVIRIAEEFEVLDGYRGFMDSGMRHQFGATFDGYLYIPETAEYNFHILGNRGMRVTLDGSMIMEVDTWPQEDTATLQLDYGLHPIHIEFYANTNNGRILFDWSSNGTIIGAQPETIGPEYFFHESEVAPEHTLTDLEVVFDPPSGSKTGAPEPRITAYIMSPNHDVSVEINGQPRVLYNGRFKAGVKLNPGQNAVSFLVRDTDGREKEFIYQMFSDREDLTLDGLIASLYAKESYNGILQQGEGLEPFATVDHPGTQLNPDAEGFTPLGWRHINRGIIVNLEGVLQITNPGFHQFRINRTGALYVNGTLVCGLNAEYNNQWKPTGEIYLGPGNHHYRVVTQDAWNGPDFDVYWSLNGGPETLVPDSVFRSGPNHARPVQHLQRNATGGRVADGILGEYLFKAGAFYEDSTGNNFHLWEDDRVVQRSPGGATFTRGGSLATQQGAARMVSVMNSTEAFSLEVDFVYEKEIENFNSRNLVSLSSANYGYMARVYAYHDHIRFRLYDYQGTQFDIDVNDALVPGQRNHVVATYANNVMKLYINGNLHQLNQNLSLRKWQKLAHFTVGQHFNRLDSPSVGDGQMFGTIYAAAVYDRALTPSEISQNRSANLVINPTLGPLPAAAPVDFPLPGTSAGELDEAHHVLSRLTFGPSPESINELLSMGVDAWITQQMAPELVDDSELDLLLNNGYYIPLHRNDDFRAYTLLRMMKSKRQLLEIMTQFWENHFNTQLDKVRSLKDELAENERFRSLAFGNFADILAASAHNYPMTVYLDSDSNIVGAQNENYAREIMELHTLGVNNGYTQTDIIEAARCFTGWTVEAGEFKFDPGLHDYGEKNLLGITIPAGGGIVDGLMVIDRLTEMPETADFISWKLCQVFIDDDPPADVVSAASATFQATNGDIAQTLLTIFNHARFRSDLNYRANKVKTPLEFLVGITRLTEAHPNTLTMLDYLEDMGMQMFNYADPTGFAEEGVSWIDTNSMLARWNLINDLTSNRGSVRTGGMDFRNFIEKYAGTSYSSILDFFENLTTHGLEPAGVRAIMESWLTSDDPGSFILDDQTLDNQVRQTLGLYLRLPEMNKQ